jgi:hypothetical protein
MKNTLVFFGHHKCASRYFRISILTELAKLNGYEILQYNVTERPFHYDDLDSLDYHFFPFEKIDVSKKQLLLFCNASARVVRRLRAHLYPVRKCWRPKTFVRRFLSWSEDHDFRGLHVSRNPRQVIVSNYFHHLKGHNVVHKENGWVWEKLGRERDIYEQETQSNGILREMCQISQELLQYQLGDWRFSKAIMERRVEDWITDEADDFIALKEFFGFSKGAFNKNARAFKNNDAQNWELVWTDKLENEFQKRYGFLLDKFGYD